MKKLLPAIFAFMTIMTVPLATSCHDPIFEMIENEVELETKGLRGDIRSIVPFKNDIYCCNNMIYKKTALSSSESGNMNEQWHKVSTSFAKGTITFLASDATYLYALAIEWEADDSEGENLPSAAAIYCTQDGTNWSKVSVPGVNLGNIDEDDRLVIFDNQMQTYSTGGTISVAGRKAYFGFYDDSTGKGETYTLSGTSAISLGKGVQYCKAANDQFSTFYAFAYSSAADMYYWAEGDDDNIYWGKTPRSGTVYSRDLNSGRILSISVTRDHLLLGTTTGIERVPINGAGEVTGGTTSFKSENNALSILKGRIFNTYVLDNSKPEGETDEYAFQTIYGSIGSSSISFNEVGLFAYYPGRNSWNRDGTDSSSSDGN